MKELIVFLAILAVSAAKLQSGLTVTFGIGLRPGRTFFFEIPQNIDDAYTAGWSQMTRPSSPLPSLVMYCPKELTCCAMYDPDTKFVVGIQSAIPMAQFKGAVFNWTIQGFIPWTPSTEHGTYMTKQVYFISEETLLKSKEERMQAASTKEVLQESAIWVTGFNQELMEIPRQDDDIVSKGFTKQACIPWMGQHYYYNMDSETKCSDDTMFNWFPLTSSKELVGVGLVAFGGLTEVTGERYTFESPSVTAVKVIVPRGPNCLYDLAEDPTLTTMHIYFVRNPWNIFCRLFG